MRLVSRTRRPRLSHPWTERACGPPRRRFTETEMAGLGNNWLGRKTNIDQIYEISIWLAGWTISSLCQGTTGQAKPEQKTFWSLGCKNKRKYHPWYCDQLLLWPLPGPMGMHQKQKSSGCIKLTKWSTTIGVVKRFDYTPLEHGSPRTHPLNSGQNQIMIPWLGRGWPTYKP